MTRMHFPFPARLPMAVRVAAVSTAIVALLVVATTSGFADLKDEVRDARQHRKEVEAQLEAAKGQLSSIDASLADALLQLEEAIGRLEEVTANLQATRLERDEAEARVARIEARLNERAAEVFMEGPASDVGFFLGATSLSDLSDRIEFVDVVQQEDADLAQEVLNVRNELIAAEDRLEQLQSEARRRYDKAQELEAQVQADLAAQQDVLADVKSSLAGATADEKAAEKAYQESCSRRQSYGGHSTVALPEEWQGLFKACPVNYPRGFGDGFGAPRYVGGYHLHKGVDIVAPMGTADLRHLRRRGERRHERLRRLGRVREREVRSHLQRAHDLDREARAGAGRRRDRLRREHWSCGRRDDHNHFEFRPNVMPPSWPASYYGHSIIDDAINPYPLLVDACG